MSSMKDDRKQDYSNVKQPRIPKVYVLQEVAGTRDGRPKFNIMGASQYGTLENKKKDTIQLKSIYMRKEK